MGDSISALSAVSLIYIFMSVPVLHCLNYCSLRIKESVSLPVLFFKTGYLMSFAFPCKFYCHPVDFYKTKPKKPCCGFAWSGVGFLDWFREN